MQMMISTINLRRYKEIIALLWKYGHSDLARQMKITGDEIESKGMETPGGGADQAELADHLEAMGGDLCQAGTTSFEPI